MIDFFGLHIGKWYVNFSPSDFKYQFKRKTVWALQRAKNGWADPDTWGFDYYLADVIIGGCKHLQKIKHGVPMSVFIRPDGTERPMEEASALWDTVLQDIINGFEAWKLICDCEWKTNKERVALENKFNRGMKLFHKHYGGLWD